MKTAYELIKRVESRVAECNVAILSHLGEISLVQIR